MSNCSTREQRPSAEDNFIAQNNTETHTACGFIWTVPTLSELLESVPAPYMQRISNSRGQAGKATHGAHECDVLCSGPSCVHCVVLLVCFVLLLFVVWAHKHRRCKDSSMCFSWVAKTTDVVTRLGCGSGTRTAFASRLQGALPHSEPLATNAEVKWQEVKNVIFRGSVKYVIPRFHHGFSGGVGGASLTPTIHRLERSRATCFAWFCDCSRFWKCCVGPRCDEEDWVCITRLLWRAAQAAAAPDILHHCWIKRVPVKVGSHCKSPDSPMSQRQLMNFNSEP